MTNKLDCLKLINFIEKSNLFTTNKIRDKKLLIAFSGGQDSSCLLTIFYILSKKWNFKLGAVYCNHCWTDSLQSSLSVFENLQMFDIPFYFVESPNSEPMKPEQRARDWRYSSFYTISKWENYDFVLTGHSLSDCVETVLFNLFRGSGLKGVCSLKENQKFSNLKLNDFFFKKNFWFSDYSDSFLNFSEKKGNKFFRKYKLFKNLGFLSIGPKLDFFVFREKGSIDKTSFLRGNKSKDRIVEFLPNSFGIKNLFTINKISQFWFFDKCGQINIKKIRLANSVRPLVFTNELKKTFSRVALGFQIKEKKLCDKRKATAKQKSFLFRSIIKRSLGTNLFSFSVFFRNKKNMKKNRSLFKLYLHKIKELQNKDKISSFITVFKPFALTLSTSKRNAKKLKKNKLSLQIQKLICKKEKEKVILSTFTRGAKARGPIFQLSNKRKLILNKIENKSLFAKRVPKFRLPQSDNVNEQEQVLPCFATQKQGKENKKNFRFSSFVFERLRKSCIAEKVPSKQKNRSSHFEVVFHKLSQTASNKKKVALIVFRPLLKINRETLFLFSKNLQIPIYYDKSNKDLNITRNYIRKVLIPLLKKINPRVEENIYKFSKIIDFYYQLSGDLRCPSNRFDIFTP